MRLRFADKVEILAPAGSAESMRAALNAGADAVYMGGSRFGARAYAENPDESGYLAAIDYAHLHGRKLYLTLNTLLKDREIEKELYCYVLPMYEQGLDAVIVQDLGVLQFLRKEFPDLTLHGSTQMTVTGSHGARLAQQQGVSRVVPARELTVPELQTITRETGVELEVFIHGALCYCYSGQCFLSSFIGGRSGNRGRCAGPCRLPYEVKKDGVTKVGSGEGYVLSLKDLCGLHALPDLMDAGVYSFKIEGRMKSPLYTAGVASVYREYADRYLEEGRKGYRVDEKDVRFLKELFDRGGFTDFWYYDMARVPGSKKKSVDHFGDPSGRSVAVKVEKPEFRKPDEAMLRSVEERFIKTNIQEPIFGAVRMKKGEPLHLQAQLQLPEGLVSAEAEGAVVEAARKQPLSEADLKKQMSKTGGTPFVWEELQVEADPDAFMPVGALNELRRAVLGKLEAGACELYRRKQQEKVAEELSVEKKTVSSVAPEWQVYIEDMCYLDPVLARKPVDAVLIDCACLELGDWKATVDRCHRKGKRCYLAMPYIFRIQSRVQWEENIERLREAGFDGYLVRNVDEAGFLAEADLPGERIGEATAYTMNGLAKEAWEGVGLSRFLLPVELNRAELKRRSDGRDGLLLYGYLPVMISAGCVRKTTEGCTRKRGWHTLTDRKQEVFPVKQECSYCCNIMYNSKPLSLHGCREEAEEIAPGFYRIHLIRESVREAEEILDRFLAEFGETSEAGQPQKEICEFTRGHFKRGVE